MLVSEVAEKIKALKATHTVEATPQRTGKRTSSAEEPVTARIRRRVVATQFEAASPEPKGLALPTDLINESDNTTLRRSGWNR